MSQQRICSALPAFLLILLIDPIMSSGNCHGCTAPHECVGNSNVQAVEDEACAPCASGQSWWPCNVEGLCWCWDPSMDRVPPPPSSGLGFSSVAPCNLFTEADFNVLTGGMHQAPYTYAGLCAAIDEYNRLHPTEHAFGMGTVEQQKAEIAAFLGNVLHESDQFKAPREYLPCGDSKVVNGKTYCKPCEAGNFDWASRQCRSSMLANGGVFASYCDTARSPPDACSCGSVSEAGSSEELAGYMEADKAFFGRGAIQLSWNYNYIRASTALTGSPDTFCTNPDLVATTEKYAWGAGLFFWMENLKTVQGSNDALSTCHIQSLSGDMGGTLWNINGGQECPAISDWHVKAVVMRINHYCRAATVMEVSSLLSFGGCVGMSEAYAQCDASVDLSQGGCPDCAIWKHGSTSHAPVTSTTTASTVLTTRPETTTSGLLGSSSVTTTSTQALISTVRVSTSATMAVTSPTPTTTATVTGTQCMDVELPAAWSGGGAHSCLTYQELGLEYCRHDELSSACCFCGGGAPGPMPSSTSQPTSLTMTTSVSWSVPTPTTAIVKTTAFVCSDAELPSAWSGGGVHTCSTYEEHGGLAYCAHKELADACCFCSRDQHQQAHFASLGINQSPISSLHGSGPIIAREISMAHGSGTIFSLATASMFIFLMQWVHL